MNIRFNTAEALSRFKEQALRYAASQTCCVLTEGNNLTYPGGGFKTLLGFGVTNRYTVGPGFFKQFKKASTRRYLFGYLGYDLKNQIEELSSQNPDLHGFPDADFFEPEHLLIFHDTGAKLLSPKARQIRAEIEAVVLPTIGTEVLYSHAGLLQTCTRKTDYLKNVARIQQHIAAGDVYELNYCLQFAAPVEQFNPVAAWMALNRLAQAPFSGFLRMDDRYILCASPERFLRKTGRTLLSQPIKGTAPRLPDAAADAASGQALLHSEKERAENRMIVDLVRNDLSRSGLPGHTLVTELFGLYGFTHVYQLISSIQARLKPGVSSAQALQYGFPAGSMTGAPKISALKIAEETENFRRGPYAGSLGYCSPDGNFDFNVLIRSVFYNAHTGIISLCAGGAITADSNPEAEYEEVLLKTKTIRLALGLESAAE